MDIKVMESQVSIKKVITALTLALFGYATATLLNTTGARLLSIDHYGDYAVAISFATLLCSGADLGGAWAIMKFIPIYKSKNETSPIKGYLFFYSCVIFILSTLILLASIAIYHFFNHTQIDHQHPIYYSVAIVPFLCIINLLSGLYLCIDRLILGAANKNIFYPALNLFLILIFYFFNGSVNSNQAVFTTAFTAAIISLVMVLHIKQIFPSLFSSTIKKTHQTKEWLKTSLPGMLNAFSLSLSTQVNLFMLEILAHNENQVSFFAASHRLSSIVFILSTGLSMIFIPKISAAMARGQKERQGLFKQYTITSISLGLPITILLCVFSKTLLSLFGSSYLEGRLALELIATSYFTTLLFLPIENFLYFGGHERIIILSVLIRLSINLSLNIFLVPVMGASGSALSLLVARIVCSMVFSYVFYTRIWQKKTSP